MRPSVGRVVHYVSHGSPVRDDGSQAYASACRAAIVTEVPELLSEQPNDGTTASLCVLNPTGQFFSQECPYDDGEITSGKDTSLCDGLGYNGGSWHWPARV